MLVIGCGNRERGDDGVGPFVAEQLRKLGISVEIQTGEALALIEAWRGCDDVVVVDAMVTGASAGTVCVWDGGKQMPTGSSTASTHGLGVGEAIELARVLGRLPVRLQVYGIEAKSVDLGNELSPEVQCAAEEVVSRIATTASAPQVLTTA
jgi:hydrogenase maturation protease